MVWMMLWWVRGLGKFHGCCELFIPLVAHALALALLTGTAQAQDSPPAKFNWRDHPSLELGAVRLDLTARVERDAHFATPATGRNESEFMWQSARQG